MKIGVILATVALCGSVMVSSYAQTEGKVKEAKPQVVSNKAKEVFACPMHANVTASSLGKCTKCGMAMEKRDGAAGMKHAKKHEAGGKCEVKAVAGEEKKGCMKNCEGQAEEGCAHECAKQGETGCAGKH